SNKAAWGGLILGDPGVSSIQHTQLASIAKSVGLNFVQYTTEVGSLQDDTLYYVTNLANYGAIIGSTDIQGGIIWEPQFQRVIQEDASYTTLALTNDLFDGHTCCIIAANHNWLKSNSGDAVKFLAGYIKAVNYIVEAKKNGGEAYTDVINIAKSSTTGLDDGEVAAALANIDYLYADSSDGSLEQLTKDIENLAGSLKDIGAITKDYGSGSAFAKAFVDDTYIKDAVAGKASKEGTSSVKVAVIGGDIHQLAIHVAIAKEYFKEYGLTVNISTGSNGGDIATLLDSKDVDIGFLGAPPATIKTINGEHIKV
ncbi:MAG: ABC transporter substrate-binding protein, partial [Candidatus Methanomethylophilaceae archaeon]|nr:ABC transporter substrate-binding protein [Candidatus Methanomethylophilaceae archaeon]